MKKIVGRGMEGKDVGRGLEFGDCDEPDWAMSCLRSGGDAGENGGDVGGKMCCSSRVDAH